MREPGPCHVSWCNEDGDHTVHRLYVASLPIWRGAWVVGVNLTQPRRQPLGVELTATSRRGNPVIIPLEPHEAERVGRALNQAAGRTQQLSRRR